jgi:hypothetical protein
MAKVEFLSQSAALAPTGRRLPLYQALLECGYRDGPRLHPGTAAAIWHRIDALRATGGGADEIRLLEGIALEVHVLKQKLAALTEDADADLMPRVRIAALTRQWIAVAPLSA